MLSMFLLAAWLAAAPSPEGPSRWLGPPGTSCTSTYDQLLNRWETVCLDGTRAVSTWDALLQRWETTVTRPSAVPPRLPPWWRDPEHRR